MVLEGLIGPKLQTADVAVNNTDFSILAQRWAVVRTGSNEETENRTARATLPFSFVVAGLVLLVILVALILF